MLFGIGLGISILARAQDQNLNGQTEAGATRAECVPWYTT